MEGFGAERKDDLSIEDTGASPGMVRLFITIGREQKIRPGDIVRYIAEKAGIDGRAIGNIKILEKFTFVEVPKDMAEKVIDAVQRGMIGGKKISAAPARPRI